MNRNKTTKRLSAIMSLLLAFVFISITAIQALHKHNYSSPKDDADDTEYVYSSEKCLVCDYMVHKQSHYAHLDYPPVVIAPVTKAVTLLSKSYAGIYKFTLQGFTNKGPPVAC